MKTILFLKIRRKEVWNLVDFFKLRCIFGKNIIPPCRQLGYLSFKKIWGVFGIPINATCSDDGQDPRFKKYQTIKTGQSITHSLTHSINK